jgi:23S rRNA (cytidine1920-2'-O)/16S rRNA (cytidine1409-2'-O)-methyltransferase
MRKRADILLVERGLFESRARARAAIEAGLVQAAGVTIDKPSAPIAADAVILAEAPHPYVSRGGVKLAHALDHFAIAVKGRVALDVGASTGGFSDVLLRRGARKVYAVDVGRGQLHASLRDEPRLVSLEAVDARRLDRFLVGEAVDLVTIDVSFISLTRLLAPALSLAGPAADLVVLVKPQFEAGRENLGKGGIVRDEAVRAAVCRRIADHVETFGWRVEGIVLSPIAGGDGNAEFLLAARRRP